MPDYAETIISAARIEANQQMGGSHIQKKSENLKLVPSKEQDKRDEVSALTFVSPLAYKLICHLDEIPVTKQMIRNMDPKLRVTKGIYMIKYIPKTDKRYRKGRPWCIGQDMIKMGIYVSGPKNWNSLCDRIPELNWIRRNSIFTDRLFYLAAHHPGMSFWFCVDWAKYESKLLNGRDPETVSVQEPEYNLFGAYKCSGDEYRKHYKDKTATLRTLADVLHEVQDAEMLPTVQEEMIAVTGETGMTREQYIKGRGGVHQPKDPVTGRFLKKNKEEE